MSIRVPRLHDTWARISINPTKVLCFKHSLAFAPAAMTKYHGCSGAYKHPSFIPHHSGGWEGQGQGANRTGSWAGG